MLDLKELGFDRRDLYLHLEMIFGLKTSHIIA